MLIGCSPVPAAVVWSVDDEDDGSIARKCSSTLMRPLLLKGDSNPPRYLVDVEGADGGADEEDEDEDVDGIFTLKPVQSMNISARSWCPDLVT